MIVVVADSSPFVVLINIGHEDLLRALFARVIIPPEVAAELRSPRRPQAVRDFIAALPSWVEERTPSAIENIAKLHAGEAAAISLARELNADQVIIDESAGRKAAGERNLRVIGTVAVLELAAERGLIDLGRAFDKVKQTDFWVSGQFLDARLARFLAIRADKRGE